MGFATGTPVMGEPLEHAAPGVAISGGQIVITTILFPAGAVKYSYRSCSGEDCNGRISCKPIWIRWRSCDNLDRWEQIAAEQSF